MWYQPQEDEPCTDAPDGDSNVVDDCTDIRHIFEFSDILSVSTTSLGLQTGEWPTCFPPLHEDRQSTLDNFLALAAPIEKDFTTSAICTEDPPSLLDTDTTIESTEAVCMTEAKYMTTVARSMTSEDAMQFVLETQNQPALISFCKQIIHVLNSSCHMGKMCFPPGIRADGTECTGKFSLVSEECDATCLNEPSHYVKRIMTEEKGFGIFTTCKIAAFQVLFEYTGRAVNPQTFSKWKEDDLRHQYVLELKDGGLIQPLVRDSANEWCLLKSHWAAHLNHQCRNANCLLIESPKRGHKTRVYVCTKWEILSKTELTLDYGWTPQPCLCSCCS